MPVGCPRYAYCHISITASVTCSILDHPVAKASLGSALTLAHVSLAAEWSDQLPAPTDVVWAPSDEPKKNAGAWRGGKDLPAPVIQEGPTVQASLGLGVVGLDVLMVLQDHPLPGSRADVVACP